VKVININIEGVILVSGYDLELATGTRNSYDGIGIPGSGKHIAPVDMLVMRVHLTSLPATSWAASG
jgi:hypothetical protein